MSFELDHSQQLQTRFHRHDEEARPNVDGDQREAECDHNSNHDCNGNNDHSADFVVNGNNEEKSFATEITYTIENSVSEVEQQKQATFTEQPFVEKLLAEGLRPETHPEIEHIKSVSIIQDVEMLFTRCTQNRHMIMRLNHKHSILKTSMSELG